MSMKNHAVIIASLLICAAIGESATNPDEADAVHHVFMKNDLGTSDVITILCTENHGGDLAPGLVAPLSGYDLQFTPSRLGGTVVTCSFTWAGTTRRLVVYDENRDEKGCGTRCCWSLTLRQACSCTPGGGCVRWTP